MKRTKTLMIKELDGDLSASEAVELDRAELTDPDLRRARQAWLRTTAAMKSLDPGVPRVPVDRWATRVAADLRPTTSWRERVAATLKRAWWRPVTMGACGLATTAVVLVALWPTPPPRLVSPTARWQRQPMPPPAPVEVTIDRSLTDDRDDAPVSIRF